MPNQQSFFETFFFGTRMSHPGARADKRTVPGCQAGMDSRTRLPVRPNQHGSPETASASRCRRMSLAAAVVCFPRSMRTWSQVSGTAATYQPNHQMESVLNTAEFLVYHVPP
jgi:hypothetical protein